MRFQISKLASSLEHISDSFVTIYSAPSGFSFPREFDLVAHNILLGETFAHDNEVCVMLYWVSAERAGAQEARVLKLLPLVRTAYAGSLVEVSTPKKPSWLNKPAQIGKLLLYLGALFGALTVVRDYFADLFYPPDVVIFAPTAGPLNLHVGDPVEVKLQVLNQARLGAADVTIESAVLTTPNDSNPSKDSIQPLVLSIQRFPHLLAGQHADLDASGIFTRQTHGMQRPAPGSLTITAKVKGGLFIPGKGLRIEPLAVNIWQDRAWESDWSLESKKIATLTIHIYPGVKYSGGLTGRLIIHSTAKPETRGILPSPGNKAESSQPVWDPGQRSYLTEVDLQTRPLDAFQGSLLKVSIPFVGPLEKRGWEELKSATRIELR